MKKIYLQTIALLAISSYAIDVQSAFWDSSKDKKKKEKAKQEKVVKESMQAMLADPQTLPTYSYSPHQAELKTLNDKVQNLELQMSANEKKALEREIELLKRENESLRNEIVLLKKEIALQAK